jgi:hypothetical protein
VASPGNFGGMVSKSLPLFATMPPVSATGSHLMTLFNFRRKKTDPEAEAREAAALEARLSAVKEKLAAPAPKGVDDVDRNAPRKRSKKIGEIAVGDGKTISCLVTDHSDSGMKLFLYDEEAVIPDVFRLRVPTLEIDREAYLVWREEKDIGVSFSPLEELDDDTAE